MPASDAVHAVQKAISSADLCSLGSSASADRHDALADITNKRVTLGLAKADQYMLQSLLYAVPLRSISLNPCWSTYALSLVTAARHCS